jgi:DNA polymerase IV
MWCNDRAALGDIFTRLCQQVAADLQRKGYVGKTIGIKLRFDNFQKCHPRPNH